MTRRSSQSPSPDEGSSTRRSTSPVRPFLVGLAAGLLVPCLLRSVVCRQERVPEHPDRRQLSRSGLIYDDGSLEPELRPEHYRGMQE